MKRPPVLKLEESGTDSFGEKDYVLKMNGKPVIKNYFHESRTGTYHSEENFMKTPVMSDADLSNLACPDVPDRVAITVKFSFELFDCRTSTVEILRRGKKLKLIYELNFTAGNNKAFIWSPYWFTTFLGEEFMSPPYKLLNQPDAFDIEEDITVAVERTAVAEGPLGEIFKADVKFMAKAIEKANLRLIAEARKFKKRSVANPKVRKGKAQQISGNSPDYPEIKPSARTHFNS